MVQNKLQAATLLMLGVSACSDASGTIIGPAVSPKESDVSKSAFSCGLTERIDAVGHMYRYTKANYLAPGSIGKVSEGSVKFAVVFADPGKRPRAAAVCTIPNTSEARAYAAELFFPRHAKPKSSGTAASKDAIPIVTTAPYTYYYAEAFGWDTGVYTGSFPWTADSNYFYYYDPAADPERDGATCNPATTPTCEQPLTENDKTVLNTLISERFRDYNELPWPKNIACLSMEIKLGEMIQAGQIKRGISDTKDNDPQLSRHFGAYNPASGNMHIDPFYLDSAATGGNWIQAEIANTLLHEAAHALGEDHPEDGGQPFEIPGYGRTLLYTNTQNNYFQALNFGSQSCIKFFK